MLIKPGYASAKLATPCNRQPGALAVPTIAIASAAAIIWTSTSLAARAHLALLVPTDCGTGRHEAQAELYYSMPWMLLLPVGAWLGARFAGAGTLICRCSLWASIIGWLMSVLFVVYR